jgi:hypothetical protein
MPKSRRKLTIRSRAMEWTSVWGAVAVGLFIVFALALREVVLWYFKIDVRLKALHEIRDLLDVVARGRPRG